MVKPGRPIGARQSLSKKLLLLIGRRVEKLSLLCEWLAAAEGKGLCLQNKKFHQLKSVEHRVNFIEHEGSFNFSDCSAKFFTLLRTLVLGNNFKNISQRSFTEYYFTNRSRNLSNAENLTQLRSFTPILKFYQK